MNKWIGGCLSAIILCVVVLLSIAAVVNPLSGWAQSRNQVKIVQIEADRDVAVAQINADRDVAIATEQKWTHIGFGFNMIVSCGLTAMTIGGVIMLTLGLLSWGQKHKPPLQDEDPFE